MKRQGVRNGLIFISFLLFPITIYYFSPALIIQGASEGIIAGSFIVFGLMFLSSLILGRAFCGWVCPAGGLQECCFSIVDKKAAGGKFNWIKYIIWVPWMAIIIWMAIEAGGLRTVDFLYQTQYGISVAEPQAYIIYYFFVLLMVVLSLLAGRRAFCHYVCWMAPFMVIGTKIKNALGLPSLRISSHKEKCRSCRSCEAKCPMSLPVSQMAQAGDMQNSECILCGKCVDTCEKNVLQFTIRTKA